MPTYTFDFNLEAWIRGLEIEADSYEEAVQQLNNLSLDDIASEGYVQDISITDIDYESDEDDYIDDDDEDDFLDDEDIDESLNEDEDYDYVYCVVDTSNDKYIEENIDYAEALRLVKDSYIVGEGYQWKIIEKVYDSEGNLIRNRDSWVDGAFVDDFDEE